MNTLEKTYCSSVAAQLMAIEVISELLVSTSPRELAAVLTDHLRELTGARTAMVLVHHPHSELDELLQVSPSRRTGLFSAEELDLFCYENTPAELPYSPLDLAAGHPLKAILLQAGIQSLARFPLRVGGEAVGMVLLFDLPGLDRFAETKQIITLLAPPFAMALKNTLDYFRVEQLAQELEEKVRERTAELIQKNRELQANEERLSMVLQTAMEGFWLVDSELRILDVNEAYCRMSGYQKDELLGLSLAVLEGVETVEDVNARAIKIRKEGADRFESQHRRKDGGSFFVEISIKYLPLEGGHYAVFIHDITERKRAEEERLKLEDQLHQSRKMESVGRLAGGVAHDFNNMLSVILGHAELALMRMSPEQPLYASIKEIRDAANRSADLTRQLLAFARKQTVYPKVLDLNETMAGMLSMLQRLIGENIHLTWKPAVHLWPVRMDSSQIDQILANLCVNARDSITDIGRIVIETENSSIDKHYCKSHPYAAPGDYVKLVVSDNGSGIDGETLEHIFEPFFTTKGAGEGTGLGLATVYGIVRQNRGFINVYSEPGKGTTFSIYLPRHEGKGVEPQEEAAAMTALQGDGTILLVEDEASILEMTAMVLEEMGYRVLKAGNARDAVRLAREHKGQLDLLMTDVIMPEMNGQELAKALEEIHPQIKCLFMSGYTADIIAHHGVLEEGIHFIQKPFRLDALAAKLRQVLEGSSQG